MVAAMVRLSLLQEDGARVLPTLYDDNYLRLLPGETHGDLVMARVRPALRLY